MQIGFEIDAVDCRVRVTDTFGARPVMVLHLFRGALGRVLAESASDSALRGAPCTFDPPSAYDVMHNSQGVLGGRPLPKPFVLRFDTDKGASVMTMRLFGRACAWRHVMLTGMISAARRGLDLKGERRSLQVVDAHLADVAPPRAVAPGPVEIDLKTPLILRARTLDGIGSGKSVPGDAITRPLFDGTALRLAGLAAWHDRDLQVEPVPVDGIITTGSDLSSQRIRRGPGRSRIGIVGRLRLDSLTPEHRHSLALAEMVHTGADSTIGAGRLRLLDDDGG